MTREEAINQLKINKQDYTYMMDDDAVDMAIKALEQEPCEDCVSRKKLEKLKRWRFSYDTNTTIPKSDLFVKLTDIKELPSVTLARKKGKWTSVTEDTPPKGTICLWCNKQRSVFASEITYRTERNSYVGKHGYFSNGLENYGNIVAWMPLPEPYKAEMESEE